MDLGSVLCLGVPEKQVGRRLRSAALEIRFVQTRHCASAGPTTSVKVANVMGLTCVVSMSSRPGFSIHDPYTIQYSPDGVDFEIAAITELIPVAAGPFVPDAFTNTNYGRGITWGLCHNTKLKGHSILMRFDCDLSLDVHDLAMKQHKYTYSPDFYYEHGLSKSQRQRIREESDRLRGE